MPLSCAKRSLIGARAKRIEQTQRHKTRNRSFKGATRDRCKILSPFPRKHGQARKEKTKVGTIYPALSAFLSSGSVCIELSYRNTVAFGKTYGWIESLLLKAMGQAYS
ncbi:hypothetical protein PVK06_040798 [Gossypium arboreum]|uniref:Uncharacterized protein n=1 Tax=Gossypium arboreum TaxID=29729 RepID=A0ABR0N791_GOSAR|nr:hypothetical protein PVK06_040798 [Gossypium arboreum]